MVDKKNPTPNSPSVIENFAMENTLSKIKGKWIGWFAILMFLTVMHPAEASEGFTLDTLGSQTI